MRTLMVCGSRKYPLPDEVAINLANHWVGRMKDDLVLITGGAEGPDRIAEVAARARGFAVLVYPPDYDRHGKGAPLYRNVDLVRAADEVVAFWDGKSSGTHHAIECAARRDKMFTIYGPDGHRMPYKYNS